VHRSPPPHLGGQVQGQVRARPGNLPQGFHDQDLRHGAGPKTRRRGALQHIYKFAEELEVGEPLWELVRVKLLPKSKGGYRTITRDGPRRMAQRFIIRDLLTAVGLDNEYDYCRRGAGGEKAMIRGVCQRTEKGYREWQTADVVKCFASLKPAHLSWLPLPKELIRDVVFLPKCAKLEIVKKPAGSWGDTLLYPSDSLSTETVRRSLPEGSVLSPLVARAFLGREIRAALGKQEVAILWWVDDLNVIEALSALEPVWDELYPAEQARILRLLIERIDVAPDGISVTLHAAGVRSLLAELVDQQPPVLAVSEPLLEAAE
jgi:hypothetical protein